MRDYAMAREKNGPTMRISNLQIIPGPNMFGPRPVTAVVLEPGGFSGRRLGDIPRLRACLACLLPGLENHRCRRKGRGAFLSRMTNAPDPWRCIVRHVTRELMTLTGLEGETCRDDGLLCYDMVIEHASEKATAYLACAAVELINSLARGGNFPLRKVIAAAKRRRPEPARPPAVQGRQRIPVIAVTGTNGKTTTVRLIGHVLGSAGRSVGMTTTHGAFIRGKLVAKGDRAERSGAQAVLGDPSVEAAVLETARGGIVHTGLGYDRSDVSVITNIRPDHFGQSGIRSLRDLVAVKAVVAERVRDGGTLVLNGDDGSLFKMARAFRSRRPEVRIVLFSLRSESPAVRSHLAAGGTACCLRDGWLTESRGSRAVRVVQACALPISFSGVADFNIANALAAFAACRALGIPAGTIRRSLLTFDHARNPGRMACFMLNGGVVLVDYAHNPDALRAVCRMLRHVARERSTAVFGVPPDRDDALIAGSAGIVARHFDRVIIKEDADGKGRRRGETADILRRELTSVKPSLKVSIVLDERQAVRTALVRMGAGDLVAVFFEQLEPVLEELERLGAVPVPAGDVLAGKAKQPCK